MKNQSSLTVPSCGSTEFDELAARYGSRYKGLLKFLTAVAKGDQLDKHILSREFDSSYKPSKNPAKNSVGIQEWASKSVYFKNTSERFEQSLEESNSVITELLYLGVVDRDHYVKGGKPYDYIMTNVTIMNYVVAKQEESVNNTLDFNKIPPAVDYKSVINKFCPKLGLMVESSPIVERVVQTLLYTEVPKFSKLPQLNVFTASSIYGDYATIHNKNNRSYLKNSWKLASSGRLFLINRTFIPVSMPSSNKSNYYDVLCGDGNYFNYDINASQISLIPKLADMVGITNYEPQLKVVRELLKTSQQTIGVDKDVVKKVLYNLVFAQPNKKLSKYSSAHSYVRKSLLNKGYSYSDANEDTNKVIDSVLNELIPFTSLLDEIKLKLDEKLIKESPEYLDNGITKINYQEFYDVLDSKNNNREGKQLSFFLQGWESAYIYNLIILCAENNIETISYEYDGIVTRQSIPESLFEKASELSGITGLKVTAKTFKNKGE